MKHALLPLALLSLSGCGALLGPPATLEETLKDAAGFINRRGTVSLPSEFGDARVEAKVEGKDTIIVSSPSVAAPQIVRYAWARNPRGANLFNRQRQPAPAFELRKPKPESNP